MWTGLYRGRGIPKIPKFVQTFFMDDPKDGLIRVGGRLLQSNLDEKVMHPVMLPMKGKLTEIIIRWCHQKTTHSGKNVTLNEIRISEYWVIQSNSAEKEMISRCYLQKAQRESWQANHGRLTLRQTKRRASIYLLWCGHVWCI